MLKRLIGTIVVKNNWAVQSIGYKKYLPLGRPEIIVQNFDRWQLDEIIIIDIDRTKNKLGPNFELLKKITNQKIMTPICYMGGIRNKNDAIHVINSGADRVAIDSLFRTNKKMAYSIASEIGRQAVVRAQPILFYNKGIFIYDYLSKNKLSLKNIDDLIYSSEYFSELMIIDVVNEGGSNSFQKKILSIFNKKKLQLICFGGITNKKQITNLFKFENVSAVAIGNSLNYRELANRSILLDNKSNKIRFVSFGKETKGAREW